MCVWERITTPSHSPASRNVSNIVISLGLVSSSGCPWNNKLLSDYYKWSYTIYYIISLRHCELIYNGVYTVTGLSCQCVSVTSVRTTIKSYKWSLFNISLLIDLFEIVCRNFFSLLLARARLFCLLFTLHTLFSSSLFVYLRTEENRKITTVKIT